MTANAVMQPTGNEVSAEAFHNHRRSGKVGDQQALVLKTLAVHSCSTRQDLSELTGKPLASICARCRELLDAGLIDVYGVTEGKPARQRLGLTVEGVAALPNHLVEKEVDQ